MANKNINKLAAKCRHLEAEGGVYAALEYLRSEGALKRLPNTVARLQAQAREVEKARARMRARLDADRCRQKAATVVAPRRGAALTTGEVARRHAAVRAAAQRIAA